MTDLSQSRKNKRTFIIGDIHGCHDELLDLLTKIQHSENDHLVFVGDLIDKGPYPARVVRLVHALTASRKVTLVLGNHEEKFLRWAKKTPEDQKKMAAHEEFSQLMAGLKPTHIRFLSSAVLWAKVPGGIVTHAGVPPKLVELFDASPDSMTELSRKRRDFYFQMCRLRYVDSDGHFVGLYQVDTNVHEYWTEWYDGRFGHVYYGHEAYMETSPTPKGKFATGIDLGCVYGGYLCAAEIDSEGNQIAFHTVKSHKTYCENTH